MVKIAIPNFCINFLNKTVKLLPILYDFVVAPFVGAWIKIIGGRYSPGRIRSHPSWVRGLKYQMADQIACAGQVAPFVGAWIKIVSDMHSVKIIMSHPSRVRGLKRCCD